MGFQEKRTQLDAQLLSKPFPSVEQLVSALSFSDKLSTILFLFKHSKYASLASQHLARWLRSGAIGAPSEEILGWVEGVEELNRPIVEVSGNWTVRKDLFMLVP